MPRIWEAGVLKALPRREGEKSQAHKPYIALLSSVLAATTQRNMLRTLHGIFPFENKIKKPLDLGEVAEGRQCLRRS